MTDPLADIVTLLQPTAPFSKLVNGAGMWRVRRAEPGQPFYCLVLNGTCRLERPGDEPVTLHETEFVLVPSMEDFSMSSANPPAPENLASRPTYIADAEVRIGVQEGPPDVQLLIGYCEFVSPDANLLVSLLPQMVRVRDEERLATLARLVRAESLAMRPGRDVILARLMEVLLIEALRSSAGSLASPGLLCGLSDDRLAPAIRRMHENPARPWSVAELAAEAALSRSAFFDRFRQTLGVSPMAYLLSWRMAKAKNLLQYQDGNIAEVAAKVGYGSASAFSVAFSRHVGVSPVQFVRGQSPAIASFSEVLPTDYLGRPE
jgi:AraC-like DNA-binding protein